MDMSLKTLMFSIKLLDEFSVEINLAKLCILLEKYFPSLNQPQRISLGDPNGFICIYASNQCSAITFMIRHYVPEQLFTISGEATNRYDNFAEFTSMKMENLRKDVETEFQCKLCEMVPVLHRNCQIPNFHANETGRLCEYDFDRVVFHQQSQFQDIKILHSPTLGNTLLLDDYHNLAENDLVYTQSLMNYGKNSYKGKEVLILGGGDGALLHELLKESPKYVTMVDIDPMVIEVAKKYMRKACGDTLDNLSGPNYKVIIDDCLIYLRKYIESGRKFDYVFNDLTDIPVSTKDSLMELIQDSNARWAFVKQIFDLSLQLIGPRGIYINHATSFNCVETIKEYENLLTSSPIKVDFHSHKAYVPSFMEEWVFYEVTKAKV